MLYSVMTVEVPPGKVNDALARMEPALARERTNGELRGCWYSEIGRLNRVLAISSYRSAEAMQEDRAKMLRGGDPLGVAEIADSIETETYAPFPGVEFLPPGRLGPIYEVRTYHLKRASVEPTFAAWAKVLEARRKVSELAIVMYGVDGHVPRFMHIWPYATLNERLSLRDAAVRQGVWPPPGGLPHLESMRSEIFLPAKFSPMQ